MASNFEELQAAAHDMMKRKGFWEEPVNLPEKLALIHSEVSEVLEVLRKNPKLASEHGLPITAVEEECADIVLRVMDFCGYLGYDLATALELKFRYNATRPHKHGKKF